MQPKARITVRFDTPPQSPNQVLAPQSQDGVRTSGNQNLTQDDAALLEQLIRRTDQPSEPVETGPVHRKLDAVEQESLLNAIFPAAPRDGQAQSQTTDKQARSALSDKQVQSPDYELAIEDELVRVSGATGGIRTKEGGPSWWKVFASAAGAIATGALFGYLVLTLFSGGSPLAAPAVDSGANPADARQANAAKAKPEAGDANPAQASAGMDIKNEQWPGAAYYWLQYGVFRSPEAMDAAVQELRDAGLPGWGDDSNGYRVYAGIATDKSEAERLAAQMPGHEVFIKSIRTEDGTGSADLLPFVKDSQLLAGMLSRLSVAALQDKMPEPLEPDELAELRGVYAQWRSSAAAVERLQAQQRQEARSMVEAFDAAMASIDQYERKVSRYHLWNIQGDLMKLLSAERRLREAFAAAST